jgi:hypothetical protein
MSHEHRPPPRLAETRGPAGDCLRRALAEQELAQPLPRFVALRERKLQRSHRQRALTLIAVAGAMLIGARVLQKEEQLPSIHAEPVAAAPDGLTAPAVVAAPERLSPTPQVSLEHRPASDPPRVPKAKRATARALSEAPANVVSDSTTSAAKLGGATACAQLARDGAAQQALDCYDDLARGEGMSAELALFEQARLEGKVLRSPERALARLDHYRQRFPQGSLRAEVMLARIDWLLSAGDSPRALAAVEEALGSGLLRERATELERIRARLNTITTP